MRAGSKSVSPCHHGCRSSGSSVVATPRPLTPKRAIENNLQIVRSLRSHPSHFKRNLRRIHQKYDGHSPLLQTSLHHLQKKRLKPRVKRVQTCVKAPKLAFLRFLRTRGDNEHSARPRCISCIHTHTIHRGHHTLRPPTTSIFLSCAGGYRHPSLCRMNHK